MESTITRVAAWQVIPGITARKTSIIVLTTHAQTEDYVLMVSTITRVTARVDLLGSAVRITSMIASMSAANTVVPVLME